MVFRGACLSSKVFRMEENCVRQSARLVAGEVYKADDKISLENSVTLMEDMDRNDFVMRGARFCLGSVKCALMVWWSERPGKTSETLLIRLEEDCVMRRSSV